MEGRPAPFEVSGFVSVMVPGFVRFLDCGLKQFGLLMHGPGSVVQAGGLQVHDGRTQVFQPLLRINVFGVALENPLFRKCALVLECCRVHLSGVSESFRHFPLLEGRGLILSRDRVKFRDHRLQLRNLLQQPSLFALLSCAPLSASATAATNPQTQTATVNTKVRGMANLLKDGVTGNSSRSYHTTGYFDQTRSRTTRLRMEPWAFPCEFIPGERKPAFVAIRERR